MELNDLVLLYNATRNLDALSQTATGRRATIKLFMQKMRKLKAPLLLLVLIVDLQTMDRLQRPIIKR